MEPVIGINTNTTSVRGMRRVAAFQISHDKLSGAHLLALSRLVNARDSSRLS